ncbi:MAG: beta strand repeat-containing protein [Thermomicrobiales bacterium]
MRHSLPSALCRVMRPGFGLLLLLAALPAITVHAATSYYVGTVADDTGTNTANCATQSNTDCTLRDALAIAISGGDTIAFGTAFPSGPQTITVATNGTLNVIHTVTLTGPLNQTVAIDGGCTVTNGYCTSGGVPIFSVGSALTVTISNLTIQHGNSATAGGGITVGDSSTLTVNACIFTANAARNGGGAIYGRHRLNAPITVNISGSSFRNNTASGGGGAIALQDGDLSVTNSTFTGNTAPTNNNGSDPAGGAIYVDDGNLFPSGVVTITGGSFASNSATAGGAIIALFVSPTITNVTFSGNTATGDTSGTGPTSFAGAIYEIAGLVTISGGGFTNNTATAGPTFGGYGGAIILDQALNVGFLIVDGAASITGTTFTNNSASGGNGGAIGVYNNSTLTANQSTFTTNYAVVGGAIFQEGASSTIIASTFTGNGAANNGLGLGGAFASENAANQTSTATIINSTFTGNHGTGGGVFSDNASTTKIINSTLYANVQPASAGHGGDILHDSTCCNPSPPSGTGTITLVNTLVGGSATTGGDLYTNSPTPSAVFLGHNNLIDDAASAGPFINGTAGNKVGVAAGVGSLGNNGGPTQTIPLLVGSPAIGGADSTVCAAATPNGAGGIDQRGVARPANQCSIGAFEPQPKPNPLPPPKPTVATIGSPSPLPVPPRPTGSPVIGATPAPLPAPRP